MNAMASEITSLTIAYRQAFIRAQINSQGDHQK